MLPQELQLAALGNIEIYNYMSPGLRYKIKFEKIIVYCLNIYSGGISVPIMFFRSVDVYLYLTYFKMTEIRRLIITLHYVVLY